MTIIPPIVAVISTCVCMSLQAGALSVSTWAGEHAEAINLELLKPYAEQAGVSISQNTASDSLDGLSDTVGIVELSLHDAIDQCDQNKLMLLPTESLAGISATRRVIQEFIPNTLQPCAVGHSVWATVVAYNAKEFDGGDRPHLIGDFFNTTYYPGKRVVRKSPRVLVEWALVASGIAKVDIYKALQDTGGAWSLIEKKLNAIRKDIIWVDHDLDAIELLQSGHATFAMLGNDSLITGTTDKYLDIGVLWDAAVTEVAMWAIPSDAPDPAISWDFLKFASSVTHSGKVASVFGYGPARISTLDSIDKSYHRLLPTAAENNLSLLWGNSKWWREGSAEIITQFAEWFVETETSTALTLASVAEELPIESHLALGSSLQALDPIDP